MNAPLGHTASGLTLADLTARFGPMPLCRIRFDPFPGTANEHDVLALEQREDRLYELVDGILVEKDMGLTESALAITLGFWLKGYALAQKLGTVAGEAGMLRQAPGLVRIPDISFISWDRLPGRRLPSEPIPDLAPDLAVEVLSKGNTAEEMQEKLRDYFTAGVRLVWFVHPKQRTVQVFHAPDQSTLLHENDMLDGGDVLPGFSLPLRQLFAELDPQ